MNCSCRRCRAARREWLIFIALVAAVGAVALVVS
jgi:hypothetical protein